MELTGPVDREREVVMGVPAEGARQAPIFPVGGIQAPLRDGHPPLRIVVGGVLVGRRGQQGETHRVSGPDLVHREHLGRKGGAAGAKG